MIKLTDILNEDENPCWKGYKQIGMKKKGGKEVPNCVPESVVNEDIDDLVGDTYSFEIGSGTDKLIKPNPREYVIEKLSEALQHYLFDSDFSYNYLDSSDQKIYLNLFQGEVLKPFLHKNNINRTLKKYFTVDSNKKIVSWKLSRRDSEKFRDDFFRKNKKIPSNIKREYYDYRLDYAGVKLKESLNEASLTISIANIVDELFPKEFFWIYKPEDKERVKSTISDLVRTLNRFYKQQGIKVRFTDTNFKMKMYSKEIKEDLSSSERIELYKLYSKAMKAMPQSPKQKKIKQQINKLRVKAGMKPLSESAINEIGIFKISNYINGIIPSGMMNTVNRQNKEKYEAVIRDLMQTLNQFWKRHNIPFRVKK